MKPPLDPILIHFTPDFGIHWYGVLIVSGVLLGALYAARSTQRDGNDPDHIWNGLVFAVILGILGARLYHVISEPSGGMVGWSYYREHPEEILMIWHGGLGIYGAIVGGALGIALYAWRSKLNPLVWLDYGAPGLALGQAIGRWGNFFNQELYGPPTTVPWGLLIDAQNRILPYNDLEAYPLGTLFHPTFLYESLWCLLVFAGLATFARRWRNRLIPGDVLLGYLVVYPLGRFFIEYLRPDAWMVGPLAAAQVVALITAAASIALLMIRHKRRSAAAPATESETSPEDAASDDSEV
jgi:phosphatidylglycerol:prolipoprotein diacylglycerol transferase